MQVVCDPQCAYLYAQEKREKKERADHRSAKEKLKTRAQWMRETQAAFNSWVRQRDAAEPCISCGRHHEGQYHAGHYLSRGAHPELAFEPLNCHKQCAPCNTHLSGNQARFRQALIAKIGIDAVEWLEGPHEPKKYSIDELKEIKARYRGMVKNGVV